MPIYTFKCNECKKEKDLFFSLKERKKFVKCDCSENTYMRRVMTLANFVINGFNEKNGYSNQEKK